jgi:hypothetical protein
MRRRPEKIAATAAVAQLPGTALPVAVPAATVARRRRLCAVTARLPVYHARRTVGAGLRV